MKTKKISKDIHFNMLVSRNCLLIKRHKPQPPSLLEK